MALEISYWSFSDFNDNVVGIPLGTATVSLSGSSAPASAAAPAGTQVASIYATEDARFTFGPTASATSHFIATGERLWVQCSQGGLPAGIQA